MLKLPGYQIGNKIYESDNSLVFKGSRKKDDQPVVFKLLKEDYPTPSELTRYRQEYEITRSLEQDGVIRVYDQRKFRNSLVMVMEDFGGESLRMLMRNDRFSLEEILEISIQAAHILGKIHERNIIHKDVNPSNLVYNRKTGKLKLIDFGIATRLTRESPVITNPENLEGTIAYISPEQTGRMNRLLDYRTDFYSLGVTIYELLTGRLPFITSDPMETVHCHIARQPESPRAINPETPIILSKLVMKLLSKTAEGRYRSAWGLEADLTKCLSDLHEHGAVRPFELGRKDSSSRFQIPQKLYGRENETEKLIAAYDRIRTNRSELFLVAGYSGIGKTSLVQEIYKPVTSSRGYYVSGKFDQLQRLPYSAIAAAFRDLIRQLLTEGAKRLEQWRSKLLEALGPNGQVIIDVIPEVELIIGPQEPVQELGPVEGANRFTLVFQNFLQVFCKAEHPIIIFLDDLQWADNLSLKIMQLMVSDDAIRHLLLIGAYRDNEVNATHALTIMLKDLEAADISPQSMALDNLSADTITSLVQDTLRRDDEDTEKLAHLIYQRTAGNPFFVNQFLKSLYQEKLLTFSPPSPKHPGGWAWDQAGIVSMSFTDNVVDLMVRNLKKLPESAQQSLRLAACIGNRFDLDTLAIILQKKDADAFDALLPAIQEGFVLPASDLVAIGEDAAQSRLVINQYKFLHDRVQQAAYSLIDDADKKEVHLKIGRLLIGHLDEKQRRKRIFELVDHLNKSISLISDPDEIYLVTELNLTAGKKALDATAYNAARVYLSTGMDMMPASIWQERHDLAMGLVSNRAQAEYLSGDFDAAESFIRQSLDHAVTVLEKAEIYNLLIIMYTMAAKYAEAIDAGEEALKLLGIDLPRTALDVALGEEKQAAIDNLGSRDIPELLDHPAISDLEKGAAIELLSNLIAVTFIADQALFPVVIIKGVNLSLIHGNNHFSCMCYSAYGILLGSVFGDFRSGYEFSMLALRLSEKYGDLNQKCMSSEVLIGHVFHWIRHIRESLTIVQDGFQAGLESGNLQFAGYIVYYNLSNIYAMGMPLDDYLDYQNDHIPFANKTKNQLVIDLLNACRLATLNLKGETEQPTEFALDGVDEKIFMNTWETNQSVQPIAYFYILKAQILFLYDQHRDAFPYADEAGGMLGLILGSTPVAEQHLYHCLIICSLWEGANDEEKAEWRPKLDVMHNQMKIWAENCPENFECRLMLIDAELARIEDDVDSALDYYDRAIQTASDQGFIQIEAIANELCARHWLKRQKEKIAAAYLRDAVYTYQLWGATRKVEMLQAQFPHLLNRQMSKKNTTVKTTRTTKTVRTTTSSSGSHSLDIISVVKASQAISGEIVENELLKKLMHIVIENAGAEKGFLLKERHGVWHVEAKGSVTMEDVLLPGTPVTEKELSQSILYYVSKTRETLVLNDASEEDIFGQDSYILSNKPKSTLCVPILHQTKLSGLLYLENNLASGVFTSDRLQTLNMLASQAAVSIENAGLYANLEQLVAERTAKLQETLTQLETKHTQLIQTQSQLVQSEKMAGLGTLTAGVAHEINNPTNFVHSGAQNLEERLQRLKGFLFKLAGEDAEDEILQSFDDKFRPIFENLDAILNGTMRIQTIVRDLRTFSRLDEAEQKKASIVDGVKSTLSLVRANYKENVEFECRFEADPILDCWPAQLNQVFMNLMVNACQAVAKKSHVQPDGYEGKLIIGAEVENDWLIIRFKDNGVGIPEDAISRIFDPFFTTKTVGEGTGLGLSISFGIVERHKGKITVNSKLGVGSTFRVYLPLSDESEEDER